jgi:drug/metabolite transporter (DMT)-like permease
MASDRRAYRLGALMCTLSAGCYAGLSIFGKLAFEAGLTLTGMLSLRFGGAALLLGGLLLALRRPLNPGGKAVVRLLFLGGVLYAAQAALFFSGLARLPASIAGLLLYVYPVIVASLDRVVNRRRLSRREGLAMALALAGVVMTLSPRPGTTVDLLGAALVLASATGLSTYIIASEGPTRRVGSRVGAMWIAAGAGLTFTAAGAAAGDLAWEQAAAVPWLMGAMVVIGTVLPVTLFLAGMARVGPTAASLLSTLEPVYTVALGVVLLAERLSPVQVSGGALVLAAAILISTQRGLAAVPAAG